ncbi:MAG TPA: hypothetical protein GX745_05445 [Clostridiales bacterium]|nr:hypothetical protein [Clostridiales bacterium]
MATINRKERLVMRAIYDLAQGKDSALLSDEQIYSKIKPKNYIKFFKKKTNSQDAQAGKFLIKDKPITQDSIKDIVYVLSYAGYFELTTAMDKDKPVYVIDMTDKGKNFLRDERDRKKNIYLLISRTVALAVLSFLVTMILKAILS